MQRNIYMRAMTMKIINKFSVLLILFLSSCSLSPGMYMTTNSSWIDNKEYIYIDSLQKDIHVMNIKDVPYSLNKSLKNPYKIGVGDQIAITVWGLPDIFPIATYNSDQSLRRVDSNGNIFFPYVGTTNALGMTQDELRNQLTSKLSKFFNDPQLDLSISGFNSQKVYLLGEVTQPSKINITDRPLSLADALGDTNGINTNTSSGSEVFIIRQAQNNVDPKIFKANLSSPAGFIEAGNFYLVNNDIVYVNAKGTTRWNRVISQFFPFSSFLNSIDNLTKS